jgi:hypothetical protein
VCTLAECLQLSFLTDCNSDTLCQGYLNWQSLVQCLDHRDSASNTVCSQARLSYRLRDALKCTSEGSFTVLERRIADQKAAETTIMAFVADCWGEAEFRLQAQAHAELRLEVVLLAIPVYVNTSTEPSLS